MARKKAKTKVVYRTKKRSKKNSNNTGMFNLKGLSAPLGAVAYGAMRERVSDMIANSTIGSKLPATQFTDEAVMLATLWGVNKIIKPKGVFGSMLRAGKTIEFARIGSTIDQLYIRKKLSNGVSNMPRLG